MIINTNNIMIVKIKHEKINNTPPQLSSSSYIKNPKPVFKKTMK